MRKKSQLLKRLRFIAYCGLYCPKCYKMKIAAPAKQLLCDLETAQKEGAKFLQEVPEIKPVLKKLIALECKKFCREGGKKCAIKTCCIKHKIIGCWKCPDFDSCKKLKPQFLANNKKLRELSIEKYIEQYK